MDGRSIKFHMELEVTPTVEELSKAISCLDAEEQATLISMLAETIDGWEKTGINMQLTYISASKKLTKNGRLLMTKIGEYAAPF